MSTSGEPAAFGTEPDCIDTGRRLSIGFLGTGIMGGHMARRIAQAGHQVAAWNRTPAKAQALSTFGVAQASDAAAAARGADAVVCMLSSGPVCDETLIGGGVLDAMRAGQPPRRDELDPRRGGAAPCGGGGRERHRLVSTRPCPGARRVRATERWPSWPAELRRCSSAPARFWR